MLTGVRAFIGFLLIACTTRVVSSGVETAASHVSPKHVAAMRAQEDLPAFVQVEDLVDAATTGTSGRIAAEGANAAANQHALALGRKRAHSRRASRARRLHRGGKADIWPFDRDPPYVRKGAKYGKKCCDETPSDQRATCEVRLRLSAAHPCDHPSILVVSTRPNAEEFCSHLHATRLFR